MADIGSQSDGANDRTAGRINHERMVALAFAGSEMVIETDGDGTLTFAAGAFRHRFGLPPEAFVGRALRDLVAPLDHETLDAAFTLLTERGRVFPFTIRLSDQARTPLALAGIAIPVQNRSPRLCLSFARLPVTAAAVLRPGTTYGLARAAAARLRAGTACDLALLEVSAQHNEAFSLDTVITEALDSVAPEGFATEIAPGRFGVLGVATTSAGLSVVVAELEAALRGKGFQGSVAAHHVDVRVNDLTPAQAVRALRQAIDVFAHSGSKGLGKAGLGAGLAGYLQQVGARTGAFRRAIHDGRFSLLYQPIVQLADRKPHHVEALIRPQPLPDCPFASPQEFVGLIEVLGLSEELDLAVADMACTAATRASLPVAFNISGQSVQSPDFRARLSKLLEASAARRDGRVLVEITETVEIQDFPEAILTADMLRALSVPFCLDDFGAGTTDVRLLRALQPNIVKLDGSYVPGVAQEGRERAIVAGMVGIAHGAGATMVVERVETDAEAEALRELGVDCGQGWLFGRPGPLPAARPAPSVARRTGAKEMWG